MANYTCVAENLAGKRISDPALLTVFGKPYHVAMEEVIYVRCLFVIFCVILLPLRKPIKPRSLEFCEVPIRKVPMKNFSFKSVNGGWTTWSSWIDCYCGSRGERVGRRRDRTCTAPRPLNGGQPCVGPNVQKTPDCVDCDLGKCSRRHSQVAL